MLQCVQHRQRQAEDGVVGLVVGQQLIEQLGYVAERDGSRIADVGGQRRLKNLAGVKACQFLAFADVIKGAHVGQRLQRTAKAAFRLLR